MKKSVAWICAFALVGLAIAANAAPPDKRASANSRAAQKSAQPPVAQNESATRLPVERVVLYKSGVGYFEHEGRVAETKASALISRAGN